MSIDKLKDDAMEAVQRLADFYADLSTAEARKKFNILTATVGGFGEKT